MKSIQLIAVAAGLAALTACGGTSTEEANNADNVVLETENLDVGLNSSDLNAVDANLGSDLNAVDANLTANVDANVATDNAVNAAE